ncbi:MAG TPA: ABC transporter ATP-binding protein [Candidatus Hydrogenedentes bacterium]|nr:ABC transporter ATP-binding protein [Candidatus Hydrogenedentota bacterium]
MNRCLAAESVAFAYEPGAPVLRDVAATVRGGAVAGIVGPNGSGKSTLLRLLCGLLEPGSGRVTLDGRPLASFRPRERARSLAFLPQGVQPVFLLSAFEVVCLGRYPHVGALAGPSSHDLEVARRCMRDTATDDIRHRSFMELSGGERQRVLLASILAQEPELLLLDEPTAALDIHHETEVFTLLARLAGDGYGVGVVTHDLNLAARFCDTMVLLSREHAVAACGAPEAVLREETLSAAYGARIRVGAHPFTGTPLVYAEPPEGAP